MLGWKVLKDGEYRLSLPRLSEEEEQMIEAVEERFKEAARVQELKSGEESKQFIRQLLLDALNEEGIYLDKDQLDYVAEAAFLHIYGFAFMDLLTADKEIEEISVIGLNKPVYVYVRNKGWKAVNVCFTTEKEISDVVNKMARGLGRHITMQNPRLDAMLPDGSRLHASLPPVSQGEITIRKFRSRPFSPKELSELGSTTAEALAFLSLVMQSDNSMLVGGNTGSGKTTLLNALFSFVPANERILIAEETPEINIQHEHQLRLVANRDMDISLKDLMYDTLRMRPDRMIVGEVRNKTEFEALFDVLLAGQARGSYATLHAQGAQEATQRMKSFGINEMDLESVDCIVVQRRMLVYDPKRRSNVEVRKMTEIAEMDNGPKTLFAFDRKSGSLRFKSGGKLLEKIADNFKMSEREIRAEWQMRTGLVEKLPAEFLPFFREFQQKMYNVKFDEERAGKQERKGAR
ncbi:putative KH and PIN-domain containing protein [uncultured archaeon]|nr:putative KH and PIN-domain containing protein [uncultured archaeon]